MKDTPILTNSKEYFRKPRSNKNEVLTNLGAPHVESFNYMLNEGLDDCVRNIVPVRFELANKDRVELWIEKVSIAQPKVPQTAILAKTKNIYPSECRQRATTYRGACNAVIGWSVNGRKMPLIDRDMGAVPIMLKSNACNLNKLTSEQLIAAGEHEQEWGGYFVVKGHEKLIRMLLMNRKNYPISIKRSTWKNRGKSFSDTGIMIRCVKTDQTSVNNVLHFLNDGTCKLMLAFEKVMSYVPVILIIKCLVNHTDQVLFQHLTRGFEDDQYFISCIQKMLRESHAQQINTHADALNFMGDIFHNRFQFVLPWATNQEICEFLLDQCILIHLNSNEDKFRLLVLMIQKLYQTVQGKCKFEGADGVMMQEILLAGHLYQKVLKDRLEMFLTYLKFAISKRCDAPSESLDDKNMTAALKHVGGIDRSMENFLSTGNITTKSGLGLMQATGLVIIAENINRMRYMSHFRAVHRGSFFVEMRTTEARQLLPDAWGFICPVHTPDGSPCGLLNHLTVHCRVSNMPDKQLVDNIPKVLAGYGMIPLNGTIHMWKEYCAVMLEGQIIGHIKYADMNQVVNKLRLIKIAGTTIPQMLEIAAVPKKEGGQFCGLYLFVGPARMMRPVTNLYAGAVEYIGTFEQVYMEIAVSADEVYPNLTTHMELSKTAFMSNLANLIPMPDYNQSPRNMYQCQMGKQTMGTPCHNWQLQSESKLYRLQTPATPLFRPVHHDIVDLDDFAMGTNAVVAVISYTGYDMEDAMIINKSAYERGFAHGSIYKSEFVELKNDSYFVRDPHDRKLEAFIDTDGLPFIGRKLSSGDPYYCYFDTNEAVYRMIKFKGKEECYIDNVKLCGDFSMNAPKIVCITVRVPRNPSVGDKFASRAGQKGICSQKWPAEDLPFSESGLIPDIVFNPHGFPSRMTIAMMIETMAGKTGSVHGLVHDATPFRFTEKDTAIDYFGRLLHDGGYNYYGTERLYSGFDGRELTADIFFGVVHYQRLRHMVSDKWQVRSTGPIDALTHQPIKGRKRGGGVRFGEMERDALIAHGASFLLQDRLLHCSDKVSVMICKNCGTLLGPINDIVRRTNDTISRITVSKATCKLCSHESDIDFIEIPYIWKFLVTQLSAVNINIKMKTLKI